LTMDAEVPLSALTLNLVDAMAQLEPYGSGNPQPLFLAGDLQVLGEPARVAAASGTSVPRPPGAHGDAGDRLRHGGPGQELMSAEGKCSLGVHAEDHEWQGRRRVELEVKDFQAGPRARLGVRCQSRVWPRTQGPTAKAVWPLCIRRASSRPHARFRAGACLHRGQIPGEKEGRQAAVRADVKRWPQRRVMAALTRVAVPSKLHGPGA